MPYKDKEKQRIYVNSYTKGRFNGAITVTKYHLGGKCIICGNPKIKELEVHHNPPLERRSRYVKDYYRLEELELRCNERAKNKCHSKTLNWRKRKRIY